MYPMGLKGREVGTEKRNKDLAKPQQSPGSGDIQMNKCDSNAEQPPLARA